MATKVKQYVVLGVYFPVDDAARQKFQTVASVIESDEITKNGLRIKNVSVKAKEQPHEEQVSDMQTGVSLYIVLTVKPCGEDPMAYHIRTLASVVGSEEAANKALVRSYKHLSGFSCMLSLEQSLQMTEQPGVSRVIPDMECTLVSCLPFNDDTDDDDDDDDADVPEYLTRKYYYKFAGDK